MDDRMPIVTAAQGPQATYEAFLAQGHFMIQRARRTGEYVFYPKVMSPSGETDLEWVKISGGGTVYAITVNRKREGSYNVALIDLALQSPFRKISESMSNHDSKIVGAGSVD